MTWKLFLLVLAACLFLVDALWVPAPARPKIQSAGLFCVVMAFIIPA